MADREELSPLKVVEGWGFTDCKPANPHFLNAETTKVVFIMDIHNHENREDEIIIQNRLHFFLFISNLTQFEPSKLLKISIVLHCST